MSPGKSATKKATYKSAKTKSLVESTTASGKMSTVWTNEEKVALAKTWYGMPAYTKDGKVVCFFQAAQKFNTRYATLGFSDAANLDEGAMWPNYFALKELNPTTEARISALVKKAVS